MPKYSFCAIVEVGWWGEIEAKNMKEAKQLLDEDHTRVPMTEGGACFKRVVVYPEKKRNTPS